MLDSYRDLIEELLATPKAFRQHLADGAPDPAVLALIADLRDRDRVVLERLHRMTHEPNAHLRALPTAAALAAAHREAGGDGETILSSFDAARGDLVSLLMNLTLKDWERTATHEIDGEITVADEVERHVEFDEEHVERVAAAFS